jgi:hypothetical protein
MTILRGTLLLACGLMLAGCVSLPSQSNWQEEAIDSARLPQPDLSVEIDGLGPCYDTDKRTLNLNSQSNVTVLVHGCFASAGRFRELAQLFAFQGQQTACFSYDDRASMQQVSAKLVQSLSTLARALPGQEITVLGHSQGGLIARKALTVEAADHFRVQGTSLRLATISSPFAGIRAAEHCASPLARVLSLGLVIPICKLISGDKWFEITSASDFIREPGTLIPQVSQYLKVVTDETGTCRRRDSQNKCIEDDFVFSLEEQYFPKVDQALRTRNVELTAGHALIVGTNNHPPLQLIELLQQQGLMQRVSAERRQTFDQLVTRIFSE